MFLAVTTRVQVVGFREYRTGGFYYYVTYLSLAIDEFLDIDFGDISKSLSDLYRKLSLRWGRFWRTRPADGDAAPSRGLLPGLAPFSTSKLKHTKDIH